MNIRSQADTPQTIDIDRLQFLKTKKGFVLANKKRIERAKQGLEHSQQLVVDSLPVLFHVNHPMLPGYVNQETPCGLSHFKPSNPELQKIKGISKSFRYQSINNKSAKIHSIFIMGSMGTLGQSRGSDLDIWLCYDPNLKTADIRKLHEKCSLIVEWAKTKKLDICFFPMNNQEFMKGKNAPLSEESSGSTQHCLLLDEFYRSALHLGGRLPLWWFVPSNYEHAYTDYCQILLEKRFIRSDEIIDFGPLSQTPIDEFITAAIWQMYKAIQSPYKSMLKLVLLEVYADQFPRPDFLAHQYKKCIEQSPEDIDESDSYLLLLSRVEKYLTEQNLTKRLETVRRSFYFKTGKSLSKLSEKNSHSWQESLLKKQISQWGWREDHLINLDRRKLWTAKEVIRERQRLVNDLMNSYRVLSEFVRQQNSNLSSLHAEVTILGRKLYAAFERKTGKIEWINPEIAPDISEPVLNFQAYVDEDNTRHWRLYCQRELTPIDLKSPLKSSRSLTELAVWAYCNRVYSNNSSVVMNESSTETTVSTFKKGNSIAPKTKHSIRELFLALESWQPIPLPKLNQDNYRGKPYALALMLIANIEPMKQAAEATIDAPSLQLDPFNISASPTSLVTTIDLVTLNSWNEVLVSSSHPSNQPCGGFPQLLTEMLTLICVNAEAPRPKFCVYCHQGDRSQSLSQRLEGVVAQAMDCFVDAGRHHSRFILCYEGRYHLWQYQAHILHYSFDGKAELYEYLGKPQQQLSPLVFDHHTLQDTPLKAMAALSNTKAIQVGYRILPAEETHPPTAEVFCFDECGSLFVELLPFRDENSLLRPLHQFIRSAINRLCLTEQHQEFFGVYPVEFYRLTKPSTAWSAQRIEITTDLRNLNFFNIQAIASNDSAQESDYSFYCDDQAFHSLDYGVKTYRRVASYILARRRQAERYPCYITDLDLSAHHNDGQSLSLQVSSYLKVKARLENKLNQALQSI